MMLLDLRAVSETPPSLSMMDLSAEDHRHAVAEWRGRMVSEHVSARVFAGLVGQMMRAGIGADRQTAVSGMIADELRHARLCASVVIALGAEPISPMPGELGDIPVHEDAGPLEALLRNVLSISCLEETVAVGILEAIRNRVAAPELAHLVRTILADEVGHARLGWKLFEDLVPLEEGLRARLGRYLVPAFRNLFSRFWRLGPAPSEAACAVGTCDAAEDRLIFLRTVSDIIVPGLETFDIPAARAADAVMSEMTT